MEDKIANYDLDAPYSNNYANSLNQLCLRYQFISGKRYNGRGVMRESFYALKALIDYLPPKGKEYMISKEPRLKGFPWEEIYVDLILTDGVTQRQVFTALDSVYETAYAWIWPNILEVHLNMGKPAYGADGHLGNKPK